MRIALTSPFCWPQERRGNERLLHDLSHWLAARGHDMTVISTAPGARVAEQDGPVRRILLPQRNPLGVPTRGINLFHSFAWQIQPEIRAGRFDVVHCLNYHDAWGVLHARGRGNRPRVVYQLVGVPDRRYFWRIPIDGLMFRRVLRGADQVLAVSHRAQDLLRSEFATPSTLLRSPTDLVPLLATPKPPPGGALRILFVGDLAEPRKGAVLLARAFNRVREVRPDAVLDYSGRTNAAVIAAIRAAVPPQAADAITFHGVGQVGDLPELYARASVFVNPALWEAQGMVLVEALAAGTPVVGCNHAGVPEIVNQPAIGRLFEPGPIVAHAATDNMALAKAILEAADLATLPQTAALCRAHAQAYGWDRLGPAYEAALTGQPAPGVAAAG